MIRKTILGIFLLSSVLLASSDVSNLEKCMIKNTDINQKKVVRKFVFLLRYGQDSDLKPLLKVNKEDIENISKETGNIISDIMMTKCKKETAALVKNNTLSNFYNKFDKVITKYLTDIYLSGNNAKSKQMQKQMTSLMIKSMDNKKFGEFIHNIYIQKK